MDHDANRFHEVTRKKGQQYNIRRIFLLHVRVRVFNSVELLNFEDMYIFIYLSNYY